MKEPVIAPIDPVVPIEQTWSDWLSQHWPVVAIAALVVIAALLAWLYLRRRRPSPPPPMPAEIARGALRDLRARLESIDPHPFSIAVSDVLRRFFAAQHGIAAPNQTTREFLDALHSRNILDPHSEQSLAEFLARCDAIKFAGVDATRDDSRALIDVAEELIGGVPA
jgi:hypothetical protein